MENHTLTNPVTLTRTYNISSYDYRVTNIILNKSVHLVVVFKDDQGLFQKEQSVNIYGEDYAKWGTDDSYIHKYIESNIETLLQ